jgi:hypothetical protein
MAKLAGPAANYGGIERVSPEKGDAALVAFDIWQSF